MGTTKRERQKANRAQKLASQVVQEKQDQRKRTFVGLGIVVVAVVVIGGLLYASQGTKSKKSATATTATVATSTSLPPIKSLKFVYGTTACPPTAGAAKPTLKFPAPPKDCLTPGKSYTAEFNTTAGTFAVSLDTAQTPGTTNNFVFLARNKYYDGNKIFRISPGIDILQSGSPHTQDASDPGPGYNLKDEGPMAADGSRGGYKYSTGDLVMARGSGPDGASAQFFLITGPKGSNLDTTGNYVLFGHVSVGLDVLTKIQDSIKVTNQPFTGDGEPNPMVTINSVTITES